MSTSVRSSCVALPSKHAAAGIDVGALGGQQQLQRLADLSAMPAADRVVRAHFHALRIAVVGNLLERHILRDVHHHGTGTAGAGDVEGLLQGLSQVARVLDQEVVLDDGPRDAHGVAFLEGIQADRRRGHLAGDDDHGNRIHVGRRDAGHRVGEARAGGHQRHAHVARGARIAVRRVHGRLLVPYQHVLDGVLLVEGVVDVEHRPARVAPHVLHAFGLQCLDEDLGPHEVLGSSGGAGGVGSARLRGGGCRRELGPGDFHDQPL